MHDRDGAAARLAEVEQGLLALTQALLAQDGQAIEATADALQRSLALALDSSSLAAQRGAESPAVRERLLRARDQVSRQREMLARAAAVTDHAVAALVPRTPAGYGADGELMLATSRGSLRA